MPCRIEETPEQRAALEEVRAVYADLEKRPIDRHCTLQTECCQFKRTGITPQLTKGEALVVAKGVRAAGRKNLPERADGGCPMLHPITSRCIVYRDRPFGCRTHFCEAAGGPYTRAEVLDLIRRLEDVDARLRGRGARPFVTAVSEALHGGD